MSRSAEVLRILERYIVEVVERFELCPWARGARTGGELAAGVVWGAPALDEWVDAAGALLARPGARIAMVVAPELAIEPAELRALRDRVAARLPHAGVADFHPRAKLELDTPARLVPFLRRAPDPLLQLVPLAVLDAARRGDLGDTPASRGHQAQILAGRAAPPRLDIAAQIAVANHATAARDIADMLAALDRITEDRAAAYARAGIGAR